ncbi:MAG TPA: glycosyltransferase 87 family protein [Streptosporangiaceae bacterium]|nr:glycosyltransferase 87 family protein [Streptosporangiaceae bacterium]
MIERRPRPGANGQPEPGSDELSATPQDDPPDQRTSPAVLPANVPDGRPAGRVAGGTVGRAGAGGLGGVSGSAPVLAAAALAGTLLAFLEKLPCRDGGWNIPGRQFQLACYTDIYPLYFTERLADGKVPYTGHPVEYPVLIGAAMQAAAWVVRSISDPFARGQRFFDVTVAGLAVCAIVGVLATAYTAGPDRRRDALLVALSPALILSAFINWDLIAMALVAVGMAAWAARRNVLAGLLFGLAVATKFYPLVFFGPLLLLCLRAGRMRAFWVATGSAALAWLAVNVPVMLAAPAGWRTFYSFSRTRPADWGAIWYFFETRRVPLLGTVHLGTLNELSAGTFAIGCVAIAALTLAAPRRPRLPQLFFLTLAVFLLTNKVWSPQYVIWLVPVAVLARPRLGAYLLWQLAEIGYFFAIWWYLLTVPGAATGVTGFHGIGQGWYFAALLARFATTALLAALVVRDIVRPDGDVVRADGDDDPAGGVLAGAPDVFVLRRGARRPARLTEQARTG